MPRKQKNLTHEEMLRRGYAVVNENFPQKDIPHYLSLTKSMFGSQEIVVLYNTGKRIATTYIPAEEFTRTLAEGLALIVGNR